MPERIAFGPFVLDSGRGALLRDGMPVPLGQRALAVLGVLAEDMGRAVPKAELMERAWPGSIVEEGNLAVQVSALRKALGTGEDGRDWIQTVPRLGYRLVPGGGAGRANLPGEPKFAVMPFQVMGDGSGEAWFADGVVEDLITAVNRFRSFAVVGRDRPR